MLKTQSRPDQRSFYKNQAAIAPTVSDDVTLGYRIGDRWLKTSSPQASYECLNASLGAAIWRSSEEQGSSGQPGFPGEVMYGTLLDYPFSGSSAAGEIQYVRLKLLGGTSYSAMTTFVDSGGGLTRNVRFAVYDQIDPEAEDQGPNNRLAQTNQFDTNGDGFFEEAFIIPFMVPVTGFYWIAIVQDSAVVKYAVTATHRANFLPIRREDPGSTADFPATAGVTTNPVSAVIYLSLVQA